MIDSYQDGKVKTVERFVNPCGWQTRWFEYFTTINDAKMLILCLFVQHIFILIDRATV